MQKFSAPAEHKSSISSRKLHDFITPVVLHSHNKRRYSLEPRTALLIFSFELEISGVAVQSIHQNDKNGDFYVELLFENDFEAVLATFCYEHGAKAA